MARKKRLPRIVLCRLYDVKAYVQNKQRIFKDGFYPATLIAIHEGEEYPYEVVYQHPAGVNSFTYRLKEDEFKEDTKRK